MLTDLKSNLNPGEKLLLALCRLDFSEEQKKGILKLLKEELDWDRYLKLVNEHGIIALEAYNIRELGLSDQVPEGVMKILDNARMKTLLRNTWLTRQWKEVNKILSGAGIKHVLLKGMALEHTVYNSQGLRQMNDMDILVKKEDVIISWQLLQEHGFISDMIKSPLHRKIITETGKHMPTLRKDGFPVEIHHRLFYEPVKNSQLSKAIDEAIPVEVDGKQAFVLSDDIQLEFLRNHLQDHLLSGDFQLRLWLDMELISPGSGPSFDRKLIADPHLSAKKKLKRTYYRTHFLTLPRETRLRYLAGDIFPSLKWMKKRYNCSTLKALLFYPGRIGKILWIL